MDEKILQNSTVGNLLKAFIDAANNRKVEPLSSFVLKYWDPSLIKERADSGRIAMILESSIDIGTIVPISTQIDGNEATMVFKEEISEDWLSCKVQVTSGPPYFITSINITVTSPLEGYEVQQITENNFSNHLENFLIKLEKMDLFSGVILISKDNHVIFQSCKGFIDRSTKIHSNLDTKFNLGSINKLFTTIAITKLVQESKISFRSTVAEILPDFKLARADEITVYHLLTHTSGLGDFFGPEFFQNMDKYVDIKDLLKLIEKQTPYFDPGSQFKYSNAGMEVVGGMIEKLSNMSYFDFVKEHIFLPSKMENTDSYFLDDPTPNLAIGYTKMYPSETQGEKEWRSNKQMARKRGSAAGGGYSTANDMILFSHNLQKNQILNSIFTNLILSKKLMKFNPRFNDENQDIFEDEHEEQININVNGGAPGINAHMAIRSPYSIVVLSNFDPPSAMRVGNKIQRLLAKLEHV